MKRHFLGLVLLSSALVAFAAPAGAEDQPAPRLRPEGIDGALVICGGTVPEAARDRFLQQAGGDKAELVVLSDGANADDPLATWKARKPASVVLVEVRVASDGR